MKYGLFDDEHREYVIQVPETNFSRTSSSACGTRWTT